MCSQVANWPNKNFCNVLGQVLYSRSVCVCEREEGREGGREGERERERERDLEREKSNQESLFSLYS